MMADCLYNAKWYELTCGMQKDVMFLIQNMQRPIYYHGFGIIVLNLETFIKVKIIFSAVKSLIEVSIYEKHLHFQLSRAVLTYYMLFKTLTN